MGESMHVDVHIDGACNVDRTSLSVVIFLTERETNA